MFDDLAGKTALVTGASSGLGAHFANVLGRAGVSVIAAARRADALEKLVAGIIRAGGDARAVQLDVSRSGSIIDAVAGIEGPIDILVNNAGIAREGAAFDCDESDWDDVVDTNLKGVFLVSKAVAMKMRENGGGSIVNVGSILGLRVASNVASYAVSKAGVLQLTKALALEWARHGIRVNALCPGYVETDINREFFATDIGKAMIRRIPQRRLGQMQSLEAPLLLLCSDASSYMTGSEVIVDGGHLVSSL